MSGSETQCGGCENIIEKITDDFYVCLLVYEECGKIKGNQQIICVHCVHKIPETLCTQQEKHTWNPEVVNVIRSNEKEAGEPSFRPSFFRVRKCVINFCVGKLGQKFWPQPVNR